MPGEPSSRASLWLCMLASALMHAALLFAVASPDSFVASALRPTQTPPEKPDPRLGIEEGVPVSIAWIGFNTETPQAAIRSDTLQPQLSVDAMQAAVRSTERARAEAAEAANAFSESVLTRMNELSELVAKMETAREKAAERAAAEASKVQEQTPAPEAAPTPPVKRAIEDDRESDATSPTPVRTSDLGKVLAREGLRIQTFKPQFTATTKLHELRSRRGSVTAVIRFEKSGAVLHASIKPGTESGEETIDEPILDSVFRWRASGSDLEKLPDTKGATVDVEIRILF